MKDTNIAVQPSKSLVALMCRKSLTENARKLMLLVAIYLGACVAMGLWFGYFSIVMGPIGFMLYSFFAMMICAFIDSKIFGELTSREGRIAMFMTPASASDKYWPRVVTMIVGVYLLLFVGWYLMCCANVLILFILHSMWVKDLLNPLNTFDYLPAREFYSLSVSTLFVQSLFIFGSVAWPKHSFLKSSATLIGLLMVLVFTVSFVIWHFETLMEKILSNTSICDYIFYTWRTLLLILSVGLLWWSYKIFERKQII